MTKLYPYSYEIVKKDGALKISTLKASTKRKALFTLKVRFPGCKVVELKPLQATYYGF